MKELKLKYGCNPNQEPARIFARKSDVSYIAQTGGSIRDNNVIETCDKYNIAMAFTGIRLFHH